MERSTDGQKQLLIPLAHVRGVKNGILNRALSAVLASQLVARVVSKLLIKNGEL